MAARFELADFTKAPLPDATVVLLTSPFFDPELVARVTESVRAFSSSLWLPQLWAARIRDVMTVVFAAVSVWTYSVGLASHDQEDYDLQINFHVECRSTKLC